MPSSSEHNRIKNISIRLSTDGFSFATLQDNGYLESGTYIVDPARSMGANLTSMLDKTELDRKAVSTASVIIPESRYTLLPQALFEEERAREILGACISLKDTEEASWNSLLESTEMLLFPIDSTIKEILEERFKDARIILTCQSKLLLDMESKGKKLFRQLTAHYENGLLTLLCREEGMIKAARTISTKTASDVIYYILNIFQSLNMDQEKDYLKLVAQEKELQGLMRHLSQFIQNIQPQAMEEDHLTLHKENLTCGS